ncbi:MAG: radical SAM family heme chaperone HemW [Chitinophagaceae bacterium]
MIIGWQEYTTSQPVNSLSSTPMAGIYIHIPYCKQACHYCNFHFSTSLKTKKEYLTCLIREIELQTGPGRPYLGDQQVGSIYFGGGTPSLLGVTEIGDILDRIKKGVQIDPQAEITLEANPDDIYPEKLAGWLQCGINRLSIGVQSFSDQDLVWMNRAHQSGQALQSILEARKSGFWNISVDLIYGLPDLTDGQWQSNLRQLVHLDIPHISCYALTVEPQTALDHFIRQKKYPPIDPDKAAHQFLMMTQILLEAGYEHYEISNFAQPGSHSRHNSSYWEGSHYLGLGPSAHSFNGISRQWNPSNNSNYFKSLQEGELPFEMEILSPVQQFNEMIMISLRTSRGCNLDQIKLKWGSSLAQYLEARSKKFILGGQMLLIGRTLQLTPAGKLLADGISSELFMSPQ